MDKGLPTLSILRDRLRVGPVETTGEATFGADWGPPGFELAEPPRAELRAEESDEGEVRLTGILRARLVVTCSRCLDEVPWEIDVPIDLRFEPDLASWDEEPGLYRLEWRGEEMEVVSALREELVLALPDYPVCKEGCRGLCPKCGTDLNRSECDCEEETGDPRWEALRHLAPETGDADDDNKDG
jgi:uncharacterized protein